MGKVSLFCFCCSILTVYGVVDIFDGVHSINKQMQARPTTASVIQQLHMASAATIANQTRIRMGKLSNKNQFDVKRMAMAVVICWREMQYGPLFHLSILREHITRFQSSAARVSWWSRRFSDSFRIHVTLSKRTAAAGVEMLIQINYKGKQRTVLGKWMNAWCNKTTTTEPRANWMDHRDGGCIRNLLFLSCLLIVSPPNSHKLGTSSFWGRIFPIGERTKGHDNRNWFAQSLPGWSSS